MREVMPVVELDYCPRAQQAMLHDTLERNRFVVSVTHRRLGKTVMAVNHLIRAALTCAKPRPRLAYIAPTYRMGKATAWDFLKYYSRPIPGVAFNESELRADYPNGGQVRIYGGDDPDNLRGLYLDGVCLDEFGLHQVDIFSTVIRPALVDRAGWALFLGTPNGKNQFYDMAQYAQAGHTGWAFVRYRASETGIIPASELEAARKDMTSDEYAQEFECSFEAAVKGAIFASELGTARSDGRVVSVPYDPVLPVDTDWDLGVGDSTAIWFSQSLRSGEIHVVDYYESSGEGLPHYAQVLTAKGYTYGTHWAPHDIQVRELGSGRSRLETAATLGIRFKTAPNCPIEDGIHAARMLFPRCWFDEKKCQPGLEALQHYKRDYNSRLNEFKAVPVHDWASHAADAFRYLAVRQQPPKAKREAVWPELRRDYGREQTAWMT
jgi:phage terminase large subunit